MIKKPICAKCQREVDYMECSRNYANNTTRYIVRCRGEAQEVNLTGFDIDESLSIKLGIAFDNNILQISS